MQYESKLGINDDDPNQNIPAPVDVHGQLSPDAPGENKQRGRNTAPRPQEYYRGYYNIADSDAQFVLPPLPPGHTFMVTSSLMQMIVARGLFSRLPCEDPHADTTKVRAVCKSYVGRPDLNFLSYTPFSVFILLGFFQHCFPPVFIYASQEIT